MLAPYLYVTYIHSADLSKTTHSLLILTVFSFFIGYMAFARLPIVKIKSTPKDLGFHPVIISTFLLVGVFGVFLGINNTIDLAISGQGSVFYNIRAGRSQQNVSLGIVPHLLLFLHLGVLMMIVEGYNYRKVSPFAFAWVSTVGFTLSRTRLLFSLLAILTAYYCRETKIRDKNITIKPVILVLSTFVGGFLMVGGAVGKLNWGIYGTVEHYFTIPLRFFDSSIVPLRHCNDSVFEALSFYPISRIFQVLGAPIEFGYSCSYPDGVAKVMLAIPYLDFGFVGPILIGLLLGSTYALVYSYTKTGSRYSIVFYSLFIYPLALSFYGYDWELITWIYYLFILTAVYLFQWFLKNSTS